MKWSVNDRVAIFWKGEGQFFLGTIKKVEDPIIYVDFDDEDKARYNTSNRDFRAFPAINKKRKSGIEPEDIHDWLKASKKTKQKKVKDLPNLSAEDLDIRILEPNLKIKPELEKQVKTDLFRSIEAIRDSKLRKMVEDYLRKYPLYITTSPRFLGQYNPVKGKIVAHPNVIDDPVLGAEVLVHEILHKVLLYSESSIFFFLKSKIYDILGLNRNSSDVLKWSKQYFSTHRTNVTLTADKV